jgi:hypothetical protein
MCVLLKELNLLTLATKRCTHFCPKAFQFGCSYSYFDSYRIRVNALVNGVACPKLRSHELSESLISLFTVAMQDKEERPCIRKKCLILTGATAAFDELVKESLQPEVLETLNIEGFTSVVFQAGKSLPCYESLPKNETGNIEIQAFDFKKEGLHADMRECQKKEGVAEEGLVISHAGGHHTLGSGVKS